MSERLSLSDVAGLLKTEKGVVSDLIAQDALHGVQEDDAWFTTPELLQGDVEILSEITRVRRLRTADTGMANDDSDPPPWRSRDWLDAAILRLSAACE